MKKPAAKKAKAATKAIPGRVLAAKTDKTPPPSKDPAGIPLTLADLSADPENPRKIEADNLDGLTYSMEDFGDLSGIVYNQRFGELVCGHQRVRGMRDKSGDLAIQTDGAAYWVDFNGQRFPIRMVDWDKKKQRAANIAANNPALAGVFTDKLQPQLEALRASDEELFTRLRMGELLETPAALRVAMDSADTPEPPAKAKTKVGDLYILGAHRLLCGSSKDADQTARLLNGRKAELLLTDPPYCSGGFQEAQRGAGTWGDIAADNLSTRGYIAMMKNVLESLRAPAAYIFTDWRMWNSLFDLMEGSGGLAVRQMIVWDKGNPGLGSLWRPQHELIMFATRGNNAREKGQATLGNVIQSQRTRNELHYTEKPVELLMTILENDTKGERKSCPVVDTFAGSGSTLVACEKMGRACYAMEIEPKFCDVIVTRWEGMTGQKAKLEPA